MAKIFTLLTLLILIAAVGIGLYQKYSSEELTKRVAEYGKQYEIKIDKSAMKREEFKITFDEAEWKSLQNKLDSTRYFNRLENVPDFSYGFNPEYAKELVTYWRKSFDWKKQIDRLNKYQQYRITVNNTIIHYIYHETNKGKSAKPTINLMLIDGWPGCSFSFNDMIEKIETEFKDVSFKIIVPSIPGYGYSTPLNRIVDFADTAFLFDAIMR
jgi:microsomal epoxide hydrolase